MPWGRALYYHRCVGVGTDALASEDLHSYGSKCRDEAVPRPPLSALSAVLGILRSVESRAENKEPRFIEDLSDPGSNG